MWAIRALLCVLALPYPVHAVTGPNAYVESGDAGGSLDSAQFITGGSFERIVGNIDNTNDVADVFAFHWIGKDFVEGGDFIAKFSSTSDPTIALYDFSKNLLGSESGTNPELILQDLMAGNYFLAIEQQPGSGSADYEVTFSPVLNPTTNPGPISSPNAVPEPSTFLLLGAGLGGLAFIRRRK
jgi:hypothetical protein